MKNFLLLGLMFVLAATPFFPASAQIGMKLEFQKRMYLQHEPVVAKVTLRNDSGQTLAFGEDENLRGELKFEILDRNQRVAKELSADRIMAGMIIKAGEENSIYVNLNLYYDLTDENRYDIRAYIKHPMMTKNYESNHKVVEVSKGVVEWSRKVGLPTYMLDPKKPKMDKSRMFKIITLMNMGRKQLYVTLEDNSYFYAVSSICTVLGQEDFVTEIDHLGRLHLLVPIAPKEFKYIVMDLNGELETDTFYRTTNTSPVMARDPNSGRVYLVGGQEFTPPPAN